MTADPPGRADRRPARPPAPDGLVVVDKPAGLTSHDVVARVRRLAGTRRVGHAGTLDPMATGVLLVGVGKATRLLGHLALNDKAYDATVRLGETTSTDDAEGELLARSPAGQLTDELLAGAFAAQCGTLVQIPPQVSAIKVGGRRAYTLARAGQQVELAGREVTVHRLDVLAVRRPPDGATVDVDVAVVCSSGTYIRAIARDAGAALGCGGHLSALRRTRVGPYALDRAGTLEELTAQLAVLPLSDAVATAFPRRDVDAAEAAVVAHGGRLAAADLGPGPVGVFGPDGEVLAVVEERGGTARPLCVFVP